MVTEKGISPHEKSQVREKKRTTKSFGLYNINVQFRFVCMLLAVSKQQVRGVHTAHRVSLVSFKLHNWVAAVPLALQYMQNTIEPNNKAIIFVPKRTCLFLGHNGRGQLKLQPCAKYERGERQEGRVNAIREEQGYVNNHAHAIRRKRK